MHKFEIPDDIPRSILSDSADILNFHVPASDFIICIAICGTGPENLGIGYKDDNHTSNVWISNFSFSDTLSWNANSATIMLQKKSGM